MKTDEGRPEAPGLYVHVPFCESRCRYCAFVSGTHLDRMPRFVEGVLREARMRPWGREPFGTVYLGGGTPSLLPLPLLTALVQGLREALPLDQAEEWTLEANPQDVTGDRLGAWRDLGFRRLSLGVQSLRDDLLTLLGRRHNGAQARRAMRLARDQGFDDLGIDLLFGIPGQSAADWTATLDEVIAFRPEHLSLYALTPEGRTPLVRAVAAGAVRLPPDALLARLYRAATDRLRRAGYLHYEVSNYAIDAGHRSRHNRRYWRRVPVLGLGPGAHSFDGARRWRNLRSLEAWLRRLDRGLLPTGMEDPLTPEQVRLEVLLLGLRSLEGLPAAMLDDAPAARSRLDRLIARGLIRRRGDVLVPTDRGMFLADGMARILA